MKQLTAILSNNTIALTLLIIFYTSMSHGADFPEKGNFSAGSKAWADNCTRCHNLRNATDLRDDQWITTVFHMRVRAGLTGTETRDILTYLQQSNVRSSSKASNDSTTVQMLTSKGVSGETVYANNCQACHGNDGKGNFPGVPDFTTSKGPLRKSETELLSNIVNGYQSDKSMMAMPPKGGNAKLTNTDIESVLDFIRNTFGE
jgi:cytochrome c5